MGEELREYDASFVLTFQAIDLDDADNKFDELLDTLYELGYKPNGVASIEESIAIV